MANMQKSAVSKLFNAYGKKVEGSSEKILAEGTITMNTFDSYRCYNGNGYCTLFVNIDGQHYAVDVDKQIKQLPATLKAITIAAVSGVYENKPYTKLRVTKVVE